MLVFGEVYTLLSCHKSFHEFKILFAYSIHIFLVCLRSRYILRRLWPCQSTLLISFAISIVFIICHRSADSRTNPTCIDYKRHNFVTTGRCATNQTLPVALVYYFCLLFNFLRHRQHGSYNVLSLVLFNILWFEVLLPVERLILNILHAQIVGNFITTFGFFLNSTKMIWLI